MENSETRSGGTSPRHRMCQKNQLPGKARGRRTALRTASGRGAEVVATVPAQAAAVLGTAPQARDPPERRPQGEQHQQRPPGDLHGAVGTKDLPGDGPVLVLDPDA